MVCLLLLLLSVGFVCWLCRSFPLTVHSPFPALAGHTGKLLRTHALVPNTSHIIKSIRMMFSCEWVPLYGFFWRARACVCASLSIWVLIGEGRRCFCLAIWCKCVYVRCLVRCLCRCGCCRCLCVCVMAVVMMVGCLHVTLTWKREYEKHIRLWAQYCYTCDIELYVLNNNILVDKWNGGMDELIREAHAREQ